MQVLDFNPRTPCGVRRPVPRAQPAHPDFNPRTPCGVRQAHKPPNTFAAQFQSTHPLRGATPMSTACKTLPALFQSTHPLRGATLCRAQFSSAALDFNPRTPCGVRPAQYQREVDGFVISIHAPLAGCDPSASAARRPSADFNPRTPCGVRLSSRRMERRMATKISIHAPLAGCDLLFLSQQAYAKYISIHAPLAGCDPYTRRIARF